MRIYKSATELIGRTPLLELVQYEKNNELGALVYAKLENFNPGGSIKDRIALNMILDAEKSGRLQEGGTIIEPTSGNTGIGIAAVGAARGYKVIITMPETMSVERQKLIKAYGAELVLTEGKLGMKGAIAKAEEILANTENAIIASQFENPANPDAHSLTTGPEIWEDTMGTVDILVAGVGTGGTLSGIGNYLKSLKPSVKVVAVEPAESPVISGGQPGPHGIMGIGAGFVPKTLDTSVYDEIITVKTQDAYAAARNLAKNEGFLIGISGGAALHAATELAKRPENARKRIVVIFADGGERYLSTPLYAEV